MSEEVEVIGTPAEVVEAEQVQEPVEQQETSEATTETEAEETNEQKEEKAKKEPWFQKRIGELTREKYEAKRLAEQAAEEARQLREYFESVQYGEAQPVGDVDSLVKQEAAKLIAQRTFDEACNKVYATGKSEFPDFDNAVANLQMVGMNREFLEIVSSSDAGHKVLHHLGTDLDEAARIAAMPPLQMARELTKLELKLNQPKPKPVSKAPAPIKPIGAGGSMPNGLSDDLPIEEWMARYHKQRSS